MIDITNIQELLIHAAWLTPVVTGLVQVIKLAFNLPSEMAPLTSVVIGAIVGALVFPAWGTGVFVGIIIGLAASGLYDFGKKTLG